MTKSNKNKRKHHGHQGQDKERKRQRHKSKGDPYEGEVYAGLKLSMEEHMFKQVKDKGFCPYFNLRRCEKSNSCTNKHVYVAEWVKALREKCNKGGDKEKAFLNAIEEDIPSVTV